MADFEKKVALIEIEVDNAAANKQVEKTTSLIIEQKDAVKENNEQIKALEKANKELEKQAKSGAISQEQATAAIKKNNEQVDTLKKANFSLSDGIKDLNKQRASAIKATKLQSNSLDSLRKKVVDQKAELNGLNTATKEGRARFDELTKSLKENNEKITSLDQSAGDYKTTVGQYANELKGAVSGTKIFGTTVGGVFDLIKANPIILFVSVLAGLVSIFKDTQAGAEFFRKTTAALNTVMGLLSDLVEAAGVAMIEAFSSPKQTLIDLKDAIVENLVKYFTEFIPNAINKVIGGFVLLKDALFELDLDKAAEGAGKLLDGLTDLNPVTAGLKTVVSAAIPAIADFAATVNESTSAAFALERQLIANEKAIADQEVVVAKSIQRQKELNRTIEDQSLAYETRIAAAEEFVKVEQAQVDESVRLAEERLKILKDQNDLTNSTEEDIQRVRDAEIALANLRAASDERQITNSNKLFGIRKQQETENLKLTKEREKRELALDTKLLAIQEANRSRSKEILGDKLSDTREYYATSRSIASDAFSKDQDRLAEEAEKIKENDALTEEERRILLKENQLATEELRAEHAETMTEIADEEAEKIKEIEKKKQEGLAKISKNGQKTVTAIFDIANNTVENKYRKRFSDLEKQFESGAITEEEYAKRRQKLEKQQAREAYEIQKKQFILKKVLSLSEIAINTARGITQAIATFPPPLSFILAASTGALGLAQTIAVATEPPPPPPSFAEGGMVVSGRSHAEGGEDIHVGGRLVGNMEGGEGLFVTKKEATNPFLQVMDSVNRDSGGRSMFGSSSRWLQEGGQVDTSVNEDNIRRIVAETVSNLPPIIVEVESIMGGMDAEMESRKVGVV